MTKASKKNTELDSLVAFAGPRVNPLKSLSPEMRAAILDAYTNKGIGPYIITRWLKQVHGIEATANQIYTFLRREMR